jgi:hypothetical protein
MGPALFIALEVGILPGDKRGDRQPVDGQS